MKLDEEVEILLCCPLCKGNLLKQPNNFICKSCGLNFPGRAVKPDEKSEELVFDFRIHHPTYCTPKGLASWSSAQSAYEQSHAMRTKKSLNEYLNEIDSVREVYTVEYQIEGKVLDVGGHQGRLRHYLDTNVNLYVSIDPYIDVFEGIGSQSNLLRAYPSLMEPCNFISANAEYLPFKSGSFDWIHMRSVVDHFADPYLAFLEAYRCCKVGGKLLVGLAILDKKHELDKALAGAQTNFRSIYKMYRNLKAFARPRHTDDHMFRLTHDQLKDLFARTGWEIIKEHWQKPPFQFCIYACGQKNSTLLTQP